MATELATFAAGCFWGVEAAFSHLDGVLATAVGYIGGQLENPTYKQVCTDRTGHAEAVQVTFDPARVSYAELLDTFWSSHDPTTIDRQGPDVGSQYRSAIFVHGAEQDRLAHESMKQAGESGVFRKKIVTQIVPAGKFYAAEDYHQKYFQKRGIEDSCHIGAGAVHTKLAADAAAARKNAAPATESCSVDGGGCSADHWKAMTDAEMRAKLTPEQYQIARHAGTEHAFTGKYWNEHRPGVYHCAVCGQELFESKTKFDSGTGWPSFYAPIRKDAVTEHTDKKYGMVRTEVVCSRCQSHLGHVFPDGPKPTGLRYCMNSAVLDLHLNEPAPA